MTFPLRHTVGVHSVSTSGIDAHRNPVKVYTPPLNQPGTPVKVYGWQTPSTTEPRMVGHDRVIVEVELLVPPDFSVTPGSVIDLPAGPTGQFDVIGEIQDLNHGPFGWRPGGVVALRRVTG